MVLQTRVRERLAVRRLLGSDPVAFDTILPCGQACLLSCGLCSS